MTVSKSDLLRSLGISETMWKLQELVGHGRKPISHPVTWGCQITRSVSEATASPAPRPRADAWGYVEIVAARSEDNG